MQEGIIEPARVSFTGAGVSPHYLSADVKFRRANAGPIRKTALLFLLSSSLWFRQNLRCKSAAARQFRARKRFIFINPWPK
jgi:hypothetical protein